MPSGEGMWLSRMRENLMSGSLGERWRRSGGPRRRIELPDGKPPGSGSRGPAGLPYPTAAGPMVHPRHRASALPDPPRGRPAEVDFGGLTLPEAAELARLAKSPECLEAA